MKSIMGNSDMTEKVIIRRLSRDFCQIWSKKYQKFNSRQKDQKSHFGILSPWPRRSKMSVDYGKWSIWLHFWNKKGNSLELKKYAVWLSLSCWYFLSFFGKKVLRLISGALHFPYFLRLVKENPDAIGGKMSRGCPGTDLALRPDMSRVTIPQLICPATVPKILVLIPTRSRHGIGTVSRKIFSPQDRVPEFFSPRDSPAKLSPVIPRPANLSPGPSPISRIFQFWVPVPNPGFSDPANFEFESRSQSRILKCVPVPVPDFRDRDCGIPGTLSRMPTPDPNCLAASLSRLLISIFVSRD